MSVRRLLDNEAATRKKQRLRMIAVDGMIDAVSNEYETELAGVNQELAAANQKCARLEATNAKLQVAHDKLQTERDHAVEKYTKLRKNCLTLTKNVYDAEAESSFELIDDHQEGAVSKNEMANQEQKDREEEEARLAGGHGEESDSSSSEPSSDDDDNDNDSDNDDDNDNNDNDNN